MGAKTCHFFTILNRISAVQIKFGKINYNDRNQKIVGLEVLVICNGMYRSGSTLQYNLAREIAEYFGGRGLGFLSSSDLGNRREELLEKGKSKKIFVLKMHEPFLETSLDLEEGQIKILYTYRDLRAVVASIKEKLNYDAKEAMDMLNDALSFEAGLLKNNSVLSQRYETYYRREPAMLEEISGFIGVSIPPNDAKVIANRHTVESAKASIGEVGSLGVFFARLKKKWPISIMFEPTDNKTLLHYNHISRFSGIIDSWKETLSAEEILQIETMHKNWLLNRGYVLVS